MNRWVKCQKMVFTRNFKAFYEVLGLSSYSDKTVSLKDPAYLSKLYTVDRENRGVDQSIDCYHL